MEARTEEVCLPIEGMECAACALRLERQLNRPAGVTRATVNFATGEARVSFDPTASGTADLVDVVRRTGFEVASRSEEGNTSETEGTGRHAREARRALFRFVVALAFTLPVFLISMFPEVFAVPARPWVLLGLSLPVVLVAGRPFYIDAWRVFLRGGAANMNTLITLGVGAAFAYSIAVTLRPQLLAGTSISAHVYYEAAAVIITLVLLGRLLEARAKVRTNSAVKRLVSLQPAEAVVVRDGTPQTVRITDIEIGDTVMLRPGGRVPVDGKLIEGETEVDESMLTGEALPAVKQAGDSVSAGTMNLGGSVLVSVSRAGSGTVLQQIIELVRSAQSRKPPVQRLADRVASIFVPGVLVIAIVTLGIWLWLGPSPQVTYAVLAFVSVLIIACPCALGLATPTAVVVGLGRAASSGVFIKGGDILERLRDVDTIVLDKTGTLTENRLAITSVEALAGYDEESLLRALAAVEMRSEHPIGQAVVDEAQRRALSIPDVEKFHVAIGGGVAGEVEGRRVVAGTELFVSEAVGSNGQENLDSDATTIHVAVDGKRVGRLLLADRLRPTSRDAVALLKKRNLEVIMATGDNPGTAVRIARSVGIDRFHAGLRPEDKVELVRELRKRGKTVAVVGDGINDAPALAEADVGIAVGAGTDVAIETADVTLMRDDIAGVAQAVITSHATMRVIKQNLFFAFVYNSLGIPIAAGVLYPVIGLLLNPMIASAAMALSSVSVVTNSLRLRSMKIRS